jgi:hypothetical protein
MPASGSQRLVSAHLAVEEGVLEQLATAGVRTVRAIPPRCAWFSEMGTCQAFRSYARWAGSVLPQPAFGYEAARKVITTI